MPLTLRHKMNPKRLLRIHPGEGWVQDTVDVRILFNGLGDLVQQSKGGFDRLWGPDYSYAYLTRLFRGSEIKVPVRCQAGPGVDATMAIAEDKVGFLKLQTLEALGRSSQINFKWSCAKYAPGVVRSGNP